MAPSKARLTAGTQHISSIGVSSFSLCIQSAGLPYSLLVLLLLLKGFKRILILGDFRKSQIDCPSSDVATAHDGRRSAMLIGSARRYKWSQMSAEYYPQSRATNETRR